MNRTLLNNPRLARTFGPFVGDFESMMDRFFGESSEEKSTAVYAPRLDIAETESKYEITVDLPGVKSDDVHVEMHEDRLTISGTREQHNEVKDRQFHRIERTTGAFSRTVMLPATVDHEAIDASYEDGVLHVTVPKMAVHQPRKIQVKSRSGETLNAARASEN